MLPELPQIKRVEVDAVINVLGCRVVVLDGYLVDTE